MNTWKYSSLCQEKYLKPCQLTGTEVTSSPLPVGTRVPVMEMDVGLFFWITELKAAQAISVRLPMATDEMRLSTI